MSRAWPQGENTWEWTSKIRPMVLERDGGLCQLRLPGCTIVAEQVHHTRDRLIYGDDPAYLVAACRRCNNKIGDPTKAKTPQKKWIVVDPYTL